MKTNLKNNVLVGSGSTILPVTINEHVTIGAGSVITKDCKKNKVYIGNPAKILVNKNNKIIKNIIK
jgi:maltose O-acetyltransferase